MQLIESVYEKIAQTFIIIIRIMTTAHGYHPCNSRQRLPLNILCRRVRRSSTDEWCHLPKFITAVIFCFVDHMGSLLVGHRRGYGWVGGQG